MNFLQQQLLQQQPLHHLATADLLVKMQGMSSSTPQQQQSLIRERVESNSSISTNSHSEFLTSPDAFMLSQQQHLQQQQQQQAFFPPMFMSMQQPPMMPQHQYISPQLLNFKLLLQLYQAKQMGLVSNANEMFSPAPSDFFQLMAAQQQIAAAAAAVQSIPSIEVLSQFSASTQVPQASATTATGGLLIPKPIRSGIPANSCNTAAAAAASSVSSKCNNISADSVSACSSQSSQDSQAIKNLQMTGSAATTTTTTTATASPLTSSIQYQPNILFYQTLTNEQMQRRRVLRREKIEQYLQKKLSRRWDVLRYEVRKKIAKTRLRVKGRFVKEEL